MKEVLLVAPCDSGPSGCGCGKSAGFLGSDTA
jgi:hypothetical protein